MRNVFKASLDALHLLLVNTQCWDENFNSLKFDEKSMLLIEMKQRLFMVIFSQFVNFCKMLCFYSVLILFL